MFLHKTISKHTKESMDDVPASALTAAAIGGEIIDDIAALNQMNPDDLLVHLVKVQSVLCNKVGQLQQQDKIQTLIDAKASFDAKIAELSSTPIVESFGFKHLATEVDTLSTYIKPIDLLTTYYIKHPRQLSHIGKFSLTERASLLTKYLRGRGLRSLGKRCLYELRRKIACDRPRAGGRFIRQKDKDNTVPIMGGAQLSTNMPNLPIHHMLSQTFPPSTGALGGSIDQLAPRPNPVPISSFLDTKPSMFHPSTSPRYLQSQQPLSMHPHFNQSPNFHMGPSPYENLQLTTFSSNTWSTSASMPTNIFSATSSNQATTLPSVSPTNVKCCCLPDMSNYLECPVHSLTSSSASYPTHLNALSMQVPQSVSHAHCPLGSYLSNPADVPIVAQSTSSKIAEYASCLQISNAPVVPPGSSQASKDAAAAYVESDAIPDMGSTANRGVLNEETLSVHISDNDEECLLFGLTKRPIEQQKIAVPTVQTISELTSSFSTYNSDLDDKRRSKRGIRSRLASRPDSELSDVSFNSAIFADS